MSQQFLPEIKAQAEPTFDYFAHERPNQPKRIIGEYVASKGFSVPLLTDADEIRRAIEDESAFFRSELAQDYDGLGGLYSSSVLDNYIGGGYTEAYRAAVLDINTKIKSGQISPTDYMCIHPHFSNWQKEREELLRVFGELGVSVDQREAILAPTASVWKYIDGTKVRIFRDPNVEGRYHFGVKPHKGYLSAHMIEQGKHSTSIQLESRDQPFVPTTFIEIYDEIRALPFFDTTQVPVMEMVQDEVTGTIYFLQYRKVDKQLEPIDHFEIKRTNDDYFTESVRGITPPEGLTYTLAINPMKLASVGITRALFADMFYMQGQIHPHDHPQKFQLACRMAELAICQDGVSFKDNHTSSVHLHAPKLAIGLFGCSDDSEERFRWFDENLLTSLRPDMYPKPLFLDVRVTSNGREATVASNWRVYEG